MRARLGSAAARDLGGVARVGQAGVAVHGKVDGGKGLLLIFCAMGACGTVLRMPHAHTSSNVCVLFSEGHLSDF